MNEKLLSHRFREFTNIENSESGAIKACDSSIPYLEVDIRMSKDECFFVYHDPVFIQNGKKKYLFKCGKKEIESWSYSNGEKILTLDKLLDIFENRKNKSQKLCLDIKDFGYEQELVALVHKKNLNENIVFISWIPQTLYEIYRIDKNFPLILSHHNITKFGWMGEWVSLLIKNLSFNLFETFYMGYRKSKVELSGNMLGITHVYLCTKLDNSLAQILAASKGGICVHYSQACNKLYKYCDKESLELWIYSVNDMDSYRKFDSIKEINVIFSDKAPFINNCLAKK